MDTTKKLCILLVFAAEADQTIAREKFEELGFGVAIASDGSEARELFAIGEFDLVLIEERLGRENGIRVADSLKQMQARRTSPTTPIVLLSNAGHLGALLSISLVVPLPLRDEDLIPIRRLIR